MTAFFDTTLTKFPAPTGERKRMPTIGDEYLKKPETEENGEPTRKRTTKQPRKRRNFVAELQDLQSRVNMAVRLLTRCTPESNHADLIAVAVETLQGGFDMNDPRR